ncbi:ABC transporter permease DevC [Leptolyngbya ohadii]|uniref:ABC transporter permease DevC n=1 Tax=Leptolyngbya ohadii TaxID=1962290 RepID=UPI000B5A09A3|nr:ABC transporter permease DevC [Leptolyngbya ohadii]
MLKSFKKTPLAWKQLVKNKARLTIALAGIAFADILVFLQMGFESSLYDSAMKPHRSLEADLVLLNPQSQALFSMQSFSRARLHQALAHEGVESVSPVYLSTGQWRNPETRIERSILVMGIDPAMAAFHLPEVNQHQDRLKAFNQVLFDQAGRPEYGAIAALFNANGTAATEMNGKAVQVAGLFTLGASFAADGNVITSDSTFLQLFPERSSDRIDIGLIQLEPDANIDQVRVSLAASLPKDVRILTIAEFAEAERNYWANSTGIGFIFGFGVLMGFIVGLVIVYQILYADVSDHLPEYATLKAMGYSDRYLLTALFQEAVILAVLGFIPGLLLSTGLYHLTYVATALPIQMTVDRAANVFTLTLAMSFGSGAIAMRKLQSADPAEVF